MPAAATAFQLHKGSIEASDIMSGCGRTALKVVGQPGGGPFPAWAARQEQDIHFGV